MVWLIVATLAASFIKGVCGFANTLVFTTILSFSFNNIQITPMDLIIGYPANVIIAWKERRQINWANQPAGGSSDHFRQHSRHFYAEECGYANH